jgi:phosphodiesterase/alkaline phosphatase D-like protein
MTVAQSLSRRTFLRLSAGAVVLPSFLAACPADDPEAGPACPLSEPADGAVPLAIDPAQIAADLTAFPLPLQAGAMHADRVLLWGFSAGEAAVELWVWRADEDGGRHLALRRSVSFDQGYLRAQVDGLAAGMWYSYALVALGAEEAIGRSAVGRFRTADGPGCLRPITLAATACTHQRNRPFRALEIMAEAEPDLFCHLGDMTYNDSAHTQAEYRARWTSQLADPGFRAILGQCGMYATWDDHEITNDDGLYRLDEAERRIATEAWFEHVAIPRLDGDRFWDSYRWGDTLEVFVLDSRGERQPETRKTDDAIYLSRRQMDWFKAGLTASTAHFKVVLNSVPMCAWPPALVVTEHDRWEGYQAQRDEVLDHIVDGGIENVWFISGDYHCGAVARVEREGPRRRIWEILAGPGGNYGNPFAFLVNNTDSEATRERLLPSGQFEFLDPGMSATLLTFDPLANTVHVQFIDPEDGTHRYSVTLDSNGPV